MSAENFSFARETFKCNLPHTHTKIGQVFGWFFVVVVRILFLSFIQYKYNFSSPPTKWKSSNVRIKYNRAEEKWKISAKSCGQKAHENRTNDATQFIDIILEFCANLSIISPNGTITLLVSGCVYVCVCLCDRNCNPYITTITNIRII